MSGVRWRSGSAAVRAAVERWLADEAGAGAELLRDNPRRRLVVVRDAAAGELLVKQFRVASGRHALRERWKARFGAGQADQEARALAALRGAGAAVPELLAHGVLAGGDALLVLPYLSGVALDDALAQPPAARRAALRSVGAAVAALHRAGFVHGDLHRGNVRIGASGPVLLDLQSARPRRSAEARLADLGQLDYSLWGRVPLTDRLRLRAAALGYGIDTGGTAALRDDTARAALRAAGRAALARADEHARSRTRRALRPGRAYARASAGALRGLRVRELGESTLGALVAAHERAQASGDATHIVKTDARARVSALEADGHRVIVKETPQRGLARALADRVRGSAGWRAWRAGHGLLARGVGAARPLAYLEERRLGVPLRSLVVLEDLRPAPDALEVAQRDPEAALAALAALVVRLHRRSVDHGDLKATHVHLGGAAPFVSRLVDLEGVRFPRRLSDEARIAALAQLNASLPDEVPAAARRNAFARYCGALPFARPTRDALVAIVTQSLARRHRWTGAGCALAQPPGATSASPR